MSRPVPYPGLPATADGAEAVGRDSRQPGEPLVFLAPESEHSSASVCEGFALAGPRTGEVVDFVAFARTERRFARQFAPDGTPSPALLAARAERLANWRRLRELAGAGELR